jgi:hypothetical protein
MVATTTYEDLESYFDSPNVTSCDIAATDIFERELRILKLAPQHAVAVDRLKAQTEIRGFPYSPPGTELRSSWDFLHDFWPTTEDFVSKFDVIFIDAAGVKGIADLKFDAMENVVLIKEPLQFQNTLPQSFGIVAVNNPAVFSLSNDYSYEHYLELSKSQENTLVNWWIDRIKESDIIRRDYKGRLIQRICDLRDMGMDDNEPMLASSLSNFINFMKQNSRIGYPSLALSSDGYINALWRESAQQRLSLEFLPSNKVGYVIFALDPNSMVLCRASGSMATQNVLDYLDYFNVKEWLQQYVLE